jgi:hypothetical protein
MSDMTPKAVYQAYKDDQKEGPLARPLFLARMLAIAVAVLGAIPTGYNFYMSYMHGIPYSQVSHRLEQYELLVKNFDCKIDYRSVTTAGQGTRVDVGACPKSGDIQLKVTTPSGKAAYEWIAFHQLEQATKSASWLSLIATEALADEAPKGLQTGQNMQTVVKSTGGVVQFAQSSGGGSLQVVCQAMPEKGKVIRIVNEGGKCYRENVNAFQGKVEKREEVQCNTPCTGKG